MVIPQDVLDFVERLYTSEVEDAKCYLDCARKYAGKEHFLRNAKMHLKNARNLRARINVMRGNG